MFFKKKLRTLRKNTTNHRQVPTGVAHFSSVPHLPAAPTNHPHPAQKWAKSAQK
jgi:hypothetical protein